MLKEQKLTAEKDYMDSFTKMHQQECQRYFGEHLLAKLEADKANKHSLDYIVGQPRCAIPTTRSSRLQKAFARQHYFEKMNKRGFYVDGRLAAANEEVKLAWNEKRRGRATSTN